MDLSFARSFSAEFPGDNPALHAGGVWVGGVRGAATFEAPADDVESVDAVARRLVPPADGAAPEAPGRAEGRGETGRGGGRRRRGGAATTPAAATAELVAAARADGASAPVVLTPSAPVVASQREVVADEMVSDVTGVATAAAPAPSDSETDVDVGDAADPFVAFVAMLADVAVHAGAAGAAQALPALLLRGEIELADVPAEVVATFVAARLVDSAAGDAPVATVCADVARVAAAWRAVLRGGDADWSVCGAATLDEWAADVIARVAGAPARSPVIRRELRGRGVAAFGWVDARVAGA